VKSKNLTDLIDFSADGPRRTTLVESDHLWSEVVCLDKSQELGPMGDPNADGLFTVFAGEVVLFAGSRRKRMKQWDSVVAEAGTEVILRNASSEPAVVLIVTAPPPAPADPADPAEADQQDQPHSDPAEEN
jgi:quercetin dioxygenase-like cupin family protein